MYLPFEIRRIIYFFLRVFPVHDETRLIPLENLLEYIEIKLYWKKGIQKEERVVIFLLPVSSNKYILSPDTNLYILHISHHIFTHIKNVSREDWINREDGTWHKI